MKDNALSRQCILCKGGNIRGRHGEDYKGRYGLEVAGEERVLDEVDDRRVVNGLGWVGLGLRIMSFHPLWEHYRLLQPMYGHVVSRWCCVAASVGRRLWQRPPGMAVW